MPYNILFKTNCIDFFCLIKTVRFCYNKCTKSPSLLKGEVSKFVLPSHFNMKKLFSLILAISYFLSSTGAIIHHHYCMGRLAKISLSCFDIKKCPRCGMKKTGDDSDCCKDIQLIVKSSNPHYSPAVVFDFNNGLLPALPVKYFAPGFFFAKDIDDHYPFAAHAPPGSEPAIYIVLQNFRI